jgi:hypothetical protein
MSDAARIVTPVVTNFRRAKNLEVGVPATQQWHAVVTSQFAMKTGRGVQNVREF